MNIFSNYKKDIIYFLKKPTSYSVQLTFPKKLKYLNVSFIFLFLGAFVSVFILHFLEYNGFISEYKNLAGTSLFQNHDIFTAYIIIIFVAPLIEELAFRSYLKFSKINLAISSAFISYFTLTYLSNSSIYVVNNNTYYKIMVSLVICFCIYYLLHKQRIFFRANNFWEKNYSLIFYASAIFFGYLHLYNYGAVNLTMLLVSPILMLQFIVAGFMFGYVRIKLGLIWSISLHIMLNAFVSLLHL